MNDKQERVGSERVNERLLEALKVARITIINDAFPIGWSVDRLVEVIAAAEAAQPVVLEPVEGDLLPAIGEEVLIHLASSDKLVPHRVVGYYAWGDRGGNKSLHRVFVRVVDRDGYQNARLLCDVRRTGEGRTQQPASAQPVAVPEEINWEYVRLNHPGVMDEDSLADGWNYCREAMLSAAQKPEGGE